MVPTVNQSAWSEAYALLFEAGMNIACIQLAGSHFQQEREDRVSIAMQEFVKGVVEKTSKSFNQMETWNDCLAMFRTIVRARVKDFHRKDYDNPVDGVEALPDVPPEFMPEKRFRLDELLPEVDRLKPDPPVPQVFRDRFVEGWSTDEIAGRRGINRNTLLTYFANGLRTLRERITRLERDLS